MTREPITAAHEAGEMGQNSPVSLAEILSALGDHTEDAVIITEGEPGASPGPRIVWCNLAFSKMTGYAPHEVIGRAPRFLQGKDTDPETRRAVAACLRLKQPVHAELLNYRKNGEAFWVELRMKPIEPSAGSKTFWISIQRDVTQRKDLEARLGAAQGKLAARLSELETSNLELRAVTRQLERREQFDSLTGLPSRRWLERLAAGSEQPNLRSSRYIVSAIDLSRFFDINDAFGFETGDGILKEFGTLLRSSVRSSDVVARVGGDVFAVISSYDGPDDELEAYGRRLLSIVEDVRIPGFSSLRLAGSVGVATATPEEGGFTVALKKADVALRRAKSRGRGSVEVYSAALHAEMQAFARLADRLAVAVEERSFQPFYQPQFTASNLDVCGLECLVRWQDGDTFITPHAFLSAAERLNYLDSIDQIVLRTILSNYASWVSDGVRMPRRLSINSPARRLLQAGYLDRLEALLAGLQIRGDAITIELLESSPIDELASALIAPIERLRDMGISIALDDFGTGHASMRSLAQLKPDLVKIDRHFVPRDSSCAYEIEVIHAMVQLAKSHGAAVTVEGVETPEQRDILRTLGCDTLQGFGLAKPMSFSDVTSFLKRSSDLTPEPIRRVG